MFSLKWILPLSLQHRFLLTVSTKQKPIPALAHPIQSHTDDRLSCHRFSSRSISIIYSATSQLSHLFLFLLMFSLQNLFECCFFYVEDWTKCNWHQDKLVVWNVHDETSKNWALGSLFGLNAHSSFCLSVNKKSTCSPANESDMAIWLSVLSLWVHFPSTRTVTVIWEAQQAFGLRISPCYQITNHA